MTLINLTPHPIRIFGPDAGPDDAPRLVIPPSGTVVRVATFDLGTQGWTDDERYELVQYGALDHLPAPELRTFFIVSLVAALAARGRDDLLAPYEEVRNAEGTVIGCRFLQKVC